MTCLTDLKVANLPYDAVEIVKLLKTLKIWIFQQKKTDGFLGKNREFF